MIRLRWALPMLAVVTATVTGCGAQPGEVDVPRPTLVPGAQPYGPGSGQVSNVEARCGVQGVFWRGNWWISTPPISAVRNPSSVKVISGTMTTTSNNQARLESPELIAPQTMSMVTGLTENTPPFTACQPSQP